MPAAQGESDKTPIERLTRREREILAVLAEDLTVPEIAEKLMVAPSSVKTHLKHLYSKLSVNSKQQALVRARELGLLGQAQPAAPASAASVQPVPAARHNLPLQVTSFFGREAEIFQILERLAEHRLVTLTGPGGVGKTRLSLRVAEELVEDFSGGAWFVDLAPLTDAALVAQQVAAAVALEADAHRPVLESLANFLRDRQMLLVLDNCEHVLDASARLADALLQACPRVRILATSREPLAIPGEAVFIVPSLAFPDPERLPAPKRLAEFVAVRLFVDRARLVQPDFAVNIANAAAVARICQRLDGIPLALELAAARLRLLNTEALSERLDDVFHLLTAGSRIALPRQQTLRATIDWSYQLLGAAEGRLLQRLSVFAGGWTLEAAEAVCAEMSAAPNHTPPTPPAGGAAPGVSRSVPASSVLDLLGSLVDKSMVVADRQGIEPRYRLLQMVREFALEKLEAGGEVERLSDRHADYFLQTAERDAPKIILKQRPYWVRKFRADHENFRGALEWLLNDPARVERGFRLIAGLWPYWESGPHLEPLHWAERGLALLQDGAVVSPSIHALMLVVAAGYVGLVNPDAAQLLAEQGVAISRGLGPEANEISVFCLMESVTYSLAKPENWDQAEAMLSEAETLASGLSSQSSREPGFYRAALDLLRGRLETLRGRLERARAHLLQAAARFDACCHEMFLMFPYQRLGDMAFRQGDNDQAYKHYSEALRLAIDNGSRNLGFLRAAMCETEVRRGNLKAALEHSRQYLIVAYEAPTPMNVLDRLEAMAKIFAKAGRPQAAARLSGAAESWSEKHGRKSSTLSSADTWLGNYLLRFSDVALAALVPDWQTRPDAESIRRAWDEGRAMGYDQAVAYALSLSLDDTSAGS